MKIAQIAPLYESVPPKYYGGTERVISYLTEELVLSGHDVTLFASGDSVTNARLCPITHRALRLDTHSIDPVADHIFMAEQVFKKAREFEIIHSHIDYIPYPLYRRMKTPHVTTLHGRLDIPNLHNLYQEYDDIPLVSISNYQRLPLSWVNWTATVYHGLPHDLYEYREKKGEYLAFIGRISPEKRVDFAIEIARKVDMPLKIAAKVDKVDKDYFETVILPLLDQPFIEYIGEIGEAQKNDFLGNAYALLFPIDWPEPFGLVMIEAMACGTPVIARLHGAVPEVMEQGITGFIVKDIEGAAQAVKEVSTLSRQRCREVFEEKFTAQRMAKNYLEVYEKLIDRKKTYRNIRFHRDPV
ncbi:MAG: glycosyltransferase family 4 protein [Syntrophales bacterium]|jgi:glycosyltransferase involved in cell wall biosynthesis|nr:glycosyltransferase family 4 protein [Syntrophales bacterium]MDY0044017.1 glycosyltransferase family 4 protein [Syntrophales bacterium]